MMKQIRLLAVLDAGLHVKAAKVPRMGSVLVGILWTDDPQPRVA